MVVMVAKAAMSWLRRTGLLPVCGNSGKKGYIEPRMVEMAGVKGSMEEAGEIWYWRCRRAR